MATEQAGPDSPDGGQAAGEVAFQQVAPADAAALPDVVAASDRFGVAALAGSAPMQNVVFSPASAVVALAMLAEGATHEGAEQLDDLLGAAGDERSEAVNALSGVLAAYDGDPASVDKEHLPDRPLAHVANNLVLDDDLAGVSRQYADRLTVFYDAAMAVADLSSASGKDVLDAWAREHSGGQIEQSAIEPDPQLLLVLQNAVLFAARWEEPFVEYMTSPGTFTAAAGTQQTVDFMSARRDMAWAQVDGWTAVALPFAEGFVAHVVLPPDGVDPAGVDPGTLDRLGQELAAADPSEVDLRLPRFETEAEVDLVEVLRAQGVTAIFDAVAEPLEGIVPGLYIGQAVQQATIAVGEEGTVAAAVTELGGLGGAGEPAPDHWFVADRPFLMVVAEATTGWDLFQVVVRSIEPAEEVEASGAGGPDGQPGTGLVKPSTWPAYSFTGPAEADPCRSADFAYPRPLATGDGTQDGDDRQSAFVRGAQAALRSLNYGKPDPVPPTGYFGPLTEQAVRSFQERKGLAVDGTIGSQTWRALHEWVNAYAGNCP